MTETLRDRLIREEGLRLFPYQDTKGIWTIGVGHNMEADPDMKDKIEHLKLTGITKDFAYTLLDRDITEHTSLLVEHLPWCGDLDWPRKSVLIDLCFNMGLGNEHHGLLSFGNTLAHMERGEWSMVADHLKSSKWYNDVGPSRADNLIRILVTGEA